MIINSISRARIANLCMPIQLTVKRQRDIVSQSTTPIIVDDMEDPHFGCTFIASGTVIQPMLFGCAVLSPSNIEVRESTLNRPFNRIVEYLR
jgi:hypothetical protein